MDYDLDEDHYESLKYVTRQIDNWLFEYLRDKEKKASKSKKKAR